MLLESLELYNFRQFKGKQKIEFSTDENRNVTVILGKNTSGKTTLIQAFFWILYGKTNFETSDFLLNLEIANEMDIDDSKYVKGILNIKHNNTKYTIKRKQRYLCVPPKRVKPDYSKLNIYVKLENGQTNKVKDSEVHNTIQRILPEKLSNYFFFDGERIGKIGENSRHGRKDISDAVKSILGLDVLSSAIKHLSGGSKWSVIGKLENKLDTRGDDELDRKKKQLRKRKQQIDKIKNQISSKEETIDFYEDEIRKKEKQLKEYKPVAKLKDEMNELERKKEKLKLERENTISEFIKVFSEDAPFYFMRPLIHKALKKLDNVEIVDTGVPEMHAKSIDYVINRKVCICGRHFEEGDEAYNNLLKEKRLLPPESLGTVIRLFMKDSRFFNEKSSKFYKLIKNLYVTIRSQKRDIDEYESQIDEISNQISDKPDLGYLESEIREYKRKIRKFQNKKEKLIKKLGEVEGSISILENEINEIAAKNEKNKFILQCIEYAKEINETLEQHYKGMENSIKKNLEEKVNSIFSRMYHGNRKIKIDDRYEYRLTTPNLSEDFQSMADESKGLETVTSFAFIAGIVSLAKETIEKEYDFSSEAYPLVMDAPFSNADEEHVSNVSKILPEVAEQVIMFVMNKDWKHAEQTLNTKLKKMYELEKRSETHTVLRGIN